MPVEDVPARDLSRVPAELDAAYEAHDDSSALRATVIAPSGDWTKKTLSHLLAKAPTHSSLGAGVSPQRRV